MDVKFDAAFMQETPVVYVREVKEGELPDEIEAKVDPAQKLFAVHAADGERLALVANRELAFALARQNDFSPVAVH